jgi:hypothetical protein
MVCSAVYIETKPLRSGLPVLASAGAVTHQIPGISRSSVNHLE